MEIRKDMNKFEFRDVLPTEEDEVSEIESICFPPNEACAEKDMKLRVAQAAENFLVAYDPEAGKIAGFLNGVATDESVFRDEFFTDIRLHDPKGKNVMLLGLDVRPEYRGHGLATEIMRRYCEREAAKGRKMLVLTCLDNKVEMYKKMGYEDKGMSASVWGGEPWHEMTIRLSEED